MVERDRPDGRLGVILRTLLLVRSRCGRHPTYRCRVRLDGAPNL